MKLKYLTVLSAAVLTAALLAGCGGDQDAERHSQDLSPSGTLRVSDEPEASVTNDAMEGGGTGRQRWPGPASVCPAPGSGIPA